MPLSPRVILVCYDSSAYVVEGRQGNWVDVRKPADVQALNELQFLSCSANLYFRERRELDAIRAEYAKVAASRPTQWFRLWTGVLTHETERFEHYRRATDADLAAGLPRIVSISPVLPVPSRWVSVFSYRLKVYSWTNGVRAAVSERPISPRALEVSTRKRWDASPGRSMRI